MCTTSLSHPPSGVTCDLSYLKQNISLIYLKLSLTSPIRPTFTFIENIITLLLRTFTPNSFGMLSLTHSQVHTSSLLGQPLECLGYGFMVTIFEHRNLGGCHFTLIDSRLATIYLIIAINNSRLL